MFGLFCSNPLGRLGKLSALPSPLTDCEEGPAEEGKGIC